MGNDTSRQCAEEWGCRAHDKDGKELTCGDRCTKFWSLAHIAGLVIILGLGTAAFFGVEYVIRLTDKDGIVIKPVIDLGGGTQLAGANQGHCSACTEATVPIESGQTALVSNFVSILSHVIEENPALVSTLIHGVLQTHVEAHRNDRPTVNLQSENYTAHPVTRHCSQAEPCSYTTDSAPAVAYLQCPSELGLQTNCEHATPLGKEAPAP